MFDQCWLQAKSAKPPGLFFSETVGRGQITQRWAGTNNTKVDDSANSTVLEAATSTKTRHADTQRVLRQQAGPNL